MNELPQFNIFDIIVLLYLLSGLYHGLRRGLSGELASVLSTGLAFVGGWKLYQPLGDHLLKVSKLSSPTAHALAFVILIVGGYIVLKIIRLLLRHLMEFSFKGKLERLGGALAGLVRVTVVASAAVLVVGLGPGAYLRNLVIEGEAEPVEGLFLAFHHLVIDAVSWRILAEDLARVSRGEPEPPRATSQLWTSTRSSARRDAISSFCPGVVGALGRGESPLPLGLLGLG